MSNSTATASRRRLAAETLKAATDCIGQIEPGMSLFVLTFGAFSIFDALCACLAQTGRADVSVWTWTVGLPSIEKLHRLQRGGKIAQGTLVIDIATAFSDTEGDQETVRVMQSWMEDFGPKSMRCLKNHAKIATIQNDRFKLLIRGSSNLNLNENVEQFDVTDGCAAFEMVRRLESELPYFGETERQAAAINAAKQPTANQRSLFDGLKTWTA